jgi:DNA-binding LytR/AlgR family response regulator
MTDLNDGDLLTRVTRYNLIRDGRMLYIDVHETLHGKLAAPFVAVPNLVNIIARQEYQGTGLSEAQALDDCLKKIASVPFEDIFPAQKPQASSPETTGSN